MVTFLTALTIPAVQASHAAIHHDDSSGVALGAHLRAFGEQALGKSVGLFVTRFELGFLFFDEFLAMLIHFGFLEQADELQVTFNYVAQFGNDGRHEATAGLPVTTARIEYALHFFYQEGNVAAFAEHG